MKSLVDPIAYARGEVSMVPVPFKAPGKACLVPGCDEPATCRGLCHPHYKRVIRGVSVAVEARGGA